MDLLDHMAQVAEELAQQPGPVKQPFFSLKTNSFSGHLVDGPE